MGHFSSTSGTHAGVPSAAILPTQRTVVLASADESLRLRLRQALESLRWQVYDAAGGAAAMAYLDELRPEALLFDGWLPDLEVEEFAECARALFPETDLLRMDGSVLNLDFRSPRRPELLQVLREVLDVADSQGSAAPEMTVKETRVSWKEGASAGSEPFATLPVKIAYGALEAGQTAVAAGFLPEMVGTSAALAELGKLVRLVAPRSTTVLIEGETGTGKELVAKALHRLSVRSNKPFIVLNCAAIPEALLEAELFGHTRGAFTGAVRSRLGRIEAADGGTLFLDEIGEMPLALQAKMLRFLECGELQRVGDNEPTYVDVRVIAATHRPLEQRAEEQTFRLDLYHRLAVFPIDVPTLRSRAEDIPLLARHFLALLGRGSETRQGKRISEAAMTRLQDHHWPGNVRELMHVLERALILAGSSPEIGAEEIRVRKRDRSF